MVRRNAVCLALVALLSLSSFAQSADKEDKAAADKSKSKLSLANFKLNESFPEGPGQPGIFGELSPNLSKICACQGRSSRMSS